MKKHLTSRNAAFFAAGGFVAALFLAGAAHAITDTVFKYTTPKTGFLAFPPAAFAPAGGTYNIYNDGSILQVNTNNTTCLVAPVNLPQGATMTGLAIWYAKISGTVDLKLVTMPFSTAAWNELLDMSLADTSFERVGKARSITGAAAKIDNVHNSYWLHFCATNSSSTYFNSVRITYTYTNAGD